jgi:DNA-binding GntR family transcriptional regulator
VEEFVMSTIVGLASISDHGLKRQVVTQRLLESVIEGRLEEGTRLRVEHLSDQLGVSVTPIRESLVELAGIGMVELRPNRGAMLRPFGPQQLREIYDLRRILESEATRYACGRIPQPELEELSRELSRLVAARRSLLWIKETRHYAFCS